MIVADRDPMARRVVRDGLQRHGIVVVAEASTGREAIELARHYQPDVLLIDVVIPGLDGIQVTRAAAAECPGTRVVVLTSFDDDEVGLLALRAGAHGFLTKSADVEALPLALRAAIDEGPLVSPRLTMRLVERLRRTREDTAGMRPVRSPLTDREWEVLDLLSLGRSTEEIADAFVLSSETVRSHVKNVLRKLEAPNRAEAVRMAGEIRAGLLIDPQRVP